MIKRPSLLFAGLMTALFCTLSAFSTQAQDNTRRANDVIDSISSSIGVLELSGLPEALELQAEHFEYDYQTGMLRCNGAVRVTQGDIRLNAEELKVVSITAGKLTFRRITAQGGVSVSNGNETATGDRAVYDQGSATITLSGRAKLGAGNKSVSGDKVVFNLNQGRAEIKSDKGPVRAVIDTGSVPGAEDEDLDDFEDEDQ